MKKLFNLFTGLLLCLNNLAADFIQGKPQIVALKYSSSDVPIVSYVVTEPPYSADPTGLADATEAIQSAIDDCGKNLGGVVFIPEGEYRIDGNIVIREGVTLRGDWAQPTPEDKTVKGTVLCLYNSKGIDSDALDVESPILLGQSTGIRDMTIYYPDQNAASPESYPYTVRCKGRLQTVMNVTLVNSFKGIRYEPDQLTVGHPNVRNVYGSPLKKGLRLNKASAVPRILGLHFAPEYWAESGLPGSPTQPDLVKTMRSLESVGIEISNSDNGIMGNIKVEGYDTGLLIGADNGVSNMKVYDFSITSCRVGISAQNYKVQGWNFTKGIVETDGSESTAVIQTGGDALFFHSCSFSSQGSMIKSNNGGLSFVKCRFDNWQDGHGIYKSSGRLVATGNTFSSELAKDQYHIHLSAGVTAAAVSGNVFNHSDPKFLTSGLDPQKVVIDLNEKEEFFEPDFQSYQFVTYFVPAREDTASIFNVQDYGAKGDCETDNTASFQSALNAAKEYGGGTVYVPGGAYRLNGSLVIPSGVELRGVHDLPHYTGDSRSILLSYVDMDNPGDSACVSLSENSGIRGFLFVRPQQKYNVHKNDTTIFDLPFVIRALGGNTSVTNICIANADKGIDFTRTDNGGHNVLWYLAAPLGNCLSIKSGQQPSFIENMQTNPVVFRGVRNSQDWTMFTANKAVSDELKWNVGPLVADSPGLWPYGTAVNVFGEGEVTFYSNFYNSPYKGYVINGSPKMTSLLSGGEGDNFYLVESEGSGDIDIEIIGDTYHPIANTDDTSFGKFNLKPNSRGKIKILNAISFDHPPTGYDINNGTLIIQSTYLTVTIPEFVKADGNAYVSIEGAFLRGGIAEFHGLCQSNESEIKIAGTLSNNAYNVSENVSVNGSSPLTVNVIETTGTGDLSLIDNPIIFPNPSDGIFRVKNIPQHLLYEKFELRIYDMMGKIVFYEPSADLTNSFQLYGNEKGLFIVQISNRNSVIQSKILFK